MAKSRLTTQPAFQIVILGCSGGPLDGGTSSYLVKSCRSPWESNCFVAIDGGSGIRAIADILSTPHSNSTFPLSIFNNTSYAGQPPAVQADFIFQQLIACFCITHAHLDHIAGLVINSASLTPNSPVKRIFGLPACLDAIKENIFNGIIWPNLTTEGTLPVGFYDLQRIPELRRFFPVASELSVAAFSISHGSAWPVEPAPFTNDRLEKCGLPPVPRITPEAAESRLPKTYESTAYVVKDETSHQHVVFFGDVEPDAVSLEPKSHHVWSFAAELLVEEKLAAVFIECSYSSICEAKQLYGHLSPPYLIQELCVLRAKVAELRRVTNNEKPDVLKGLAVVVNHVKDDLRPAERGAESPGALIVKILEEFSSKENLGCSFQFAEAGSSIYI